MNVAIFMKMLERLSVPIVVVTPTKPIGSFNTNFIVNG